MMNTFYNELMNSNFVMSQKTSQTGFNKDLMTWQINMSKLSVLV
jgi:hypothetical protein